MLPKPHSLPPLTPHSQDLESITAAAKSPACFAAPDPSDNDASNNPTPAADRVSPHPQIKLATTACSIAAQSSFLLSTS